MRYDKIAQDWHRQQADKNKKKMVKNQCYFEREEALEREFLSHVKSIGTQVKSIGGFIFCVAAVSMWAVFI